MVVVHNKKKTMPIVILLQVAFVLLGTPLFMFIDSRWLTSYFSHGQDVANVIMIVTYCWMLFVATQRLYWLILLMTISGLVAEIFGSFILALYQYRLHNIPVYIPLGHAVIYACVYHVSNHPFLWRHHRVIEFYLIKAAFVLIFTSLIMLHDVASFIGYAIFLLVLRTKKKQMFYLAMFLMTYYIELCGTVCSAWEWYGVLGNHPYFPSIAYTPAGAGGLYILIDLGCNFIYYQLIKIIRDVKQYIDSCVSINY